MFESKSPLVFSCDLTKDALGAPDTGMYTALCPIGTTVFGWFSKFL